MQAYPKKQLDMLVVAVPVLDLQYPPSSPAVIKGCLRTAGYTAKTNDYNLLLYKLNNELGYEWHKEQYEFESTYFGEFDAKTNEEFLFGKRSNIASEWIRRCIDDIKKNNPRWLGISVFSYKSHKSALFLAMEVKRQLPKVKISLGGRGVSSYFLGPDFSHIKRNIIKRLGPLPIDESIGKFGKLLLHYNLVDHVIEGDGEIAVIQLIQGVSNNLTIGRIEDIDIEDVPYVDYDDYEINDYDYVTEPLLAITGSKGCVRKCTFCDIPVLWPKFKFRSGEHIANEMTHLYEKHGVKKFYLTDSLVNGSLNAFRDFIQTLAAYNNKSDDKITWVGQYITKKASRRQEDEYYQMLADSGAEGLTIGVESGSDNVRNHMKKNFSTYDIDTEMAYFDKYKISCVLLFFSCYPTETLDDFIDTINMLIRYHKYCASGTIYKITLGVPYTHHAQTPLWNMQEEIGLDNKNETDILWLLDSNKELTFYERVRRRLILHEVTVALKLPMSRNTPEINQLLNTYRLHYDDIVNYFGEKPDIDWYDDMWDLTPYEHLLTPPFIQRRLKNHLNSNKDLVDRTLELHTDINDEISFDSELYLEMKKELLSGL